MNKSHLCSLLIAISSVLTGCSSTPDESLVSAEARKRAIVINGALPLTLGEIRLTRATSSERTVMIDAQVQTQHTGRTDDVALKMVRGLCENAQVMETVTLGVDYKLIFLNESGRKVNETVINQLTCLL